MKSCTTLVLAALFTIGCGPAQSSGDDDDDTIIVDDAGNNVTPDSGPTVRTMQTFIAPGAPADAPMQFNGPTSGGTAPTLVYPNDGVMVPANLNTMEFHFMPGTGNNLFELTFMGTWIEAKVYFTCTALGTGCSFTPEQAVWDALAMNEKGQAPVAYTLRAVASAGGPIGASSSRQIAFSQEPITGGLYYWATAGSTGKVMRYEFGRRNQNAETFIDTIQAGAQTCVGCHAMSRDGKKVTVGTEIPSQGTVKVFDVATRNKLYDVPSSGGGFFPSAPSFFAFNPDATQLLTAPGTAIALRDAATGTAINENFIASGTMPDWSADGNKIVYAKPGASVPVANPNVEKGSIEMITKTGATWSAPTSLVPYANATNNYYPSFSPDGNWIVFNRGPSDGTSFDGPNAQVWVVSTAGGTPIQLVKGTTTRESWAKWAPDVQQYRGGTLMWMTFTSYRQVGLRPQGAEPTAQIWMVGFDPAKAAAGQDPSYASFWLPFQEEATGNHIAQWVTTVERQTCNNGSPCGTGEFCSGGRCIPNID